MVNDCARSLPKLAVPSCVCPTLLTSGPPSAGAGAVAGYRHELADSGVYLAGEVDADFRGGAADGEFNGIGMSPGRNQLGEFWADQWTFEGNRSYGIAVRLGASPAALRPLHASL